MYTDVARMKFEIGNRGISFRRTNSFQQSIVTIVHALEYLREAPMSKYRPLFRQLSK